MKHMKIVLGVAVVFVIIIVLAGLELWSQIGRYQAYWNRQNVQPAQKGELLYVALGDSTAQGIGASQPHKGYVGLIAKDLASKHDKQVRTVNLSKTGATLSDVLQRQLPLMKQQPVDDTTVVTIEIGANDMLSFDAQKFETEMDQLMAQLPPQTVISDIPYFGGSRLRRLEPNARQANVIMYRLAATHGFKLAALHEAIKSKNTWRDYAIDRFHPSNYNYRTQWTPAFLERL